MKLLDENKVISDELRSIIAHTNDFMFVKDTNLVYIAVSPNYAQHFVGKNFPEEVVGQTDFDLFSEEIATEYRNNDKELLASGKVMCEFQETYPLKQANHQSCVSSKYVIRNPDGTPLAIFGLYHDFSSKVDADISRHNEILNNVNKALCSTFFASIYADLTTDNFKLIHATNYVKELISKCNNNHEGISAFIKTFVKPEFQPKMQVFCDISTLAQRLKNHKVLECDYLSTVASGWCRTSFIPTERDENGNVTHVLLVVSSLDEERARELETDLINKKSITAIFNEVPGGIVLYEWNGVELKVLRMSQYYQNLYGYSMLNNTGRPDLSRIHPDDRDDYRKAILQALNETHSLKYVFRVWNQKENKYGWTQINAISRPYHGNKSLVYAIYADVTQQKEAELAVAKKQASLEAALNASDQLCCEYDPKLHKMECFTRRNYFDLAPTLTDYPECLRSLNIFHPDDLELFIRTVHLADDGKTTAHCDVRAQVEGKYRWYSCTMRPYFDPEKERNVAIISIINATVRMESIKAYEERLKNLSGNYEHSLTFCNVNLTRDSYEIIGADNKLKHYLQNNRSIEETMKYAAQNVIGTESRAKYQKLFNRENMLREFAKGTTNFRMEHFLITSPNHIEWVESGFDLIAHPVTKEIVGVCHTRSANTEKISNIMLHKAMQHDYDKAYVIWSESGEYYLFDTDKNEFCSLHQNYWEYIYNTVSQSLSLSEKERQALKSHLSKENITNVLSTQNEFTYNYYVTKDDVTRRMQLKVVWDNKEAGLLCASIRNITDSDLIARYRHDSEHDSVTGLYNRVTVFKKCRELLKANPNEQFCMFHGDLRNFHLYNTFFGEKAGNELLCAIASLLPKIENDYDHFAYGRIESDVFCVFFPLRPELLEQHTKFLIEELRNIRDDFLMEPHLGLYLVSDKTMPIEAMFSRASIAAKSNKKDMFGIISLYDEEMERSLLDNQLVTSEMQKAIDNEEFQVYLQPKYSLRSEKIVGAEALVRWLHPEKGMISPGKFIPVFEGNGFITTLDRYMWEHVCMLLRRWQDEGRKLLPVSVNVSRLSMYIQTTVPFLKNLVQRYGIEPKYLELELTESAYMDDPEELKRMLQELQDAGFVILMDDFGSGYSSLNTLRDLPVDILKLDMKFLSRSILNDVRSAVVLSSIVRMSKLLHLPIVAEGVEKREQADYLCSIGCEYVQGFLFAKPMPVADYEQTLDTEPTELHLKTENSRRQAILKSISAADDANHLFCDNISAPIVVFETDNGANRVLRANSTFMREFNLTNDLAPASEIFRRRLDAHSLKVLRESIADCAQNKRPVKFGFEWHDDTGNKYFVANLDYIGTIDRISTIGAVLIDITDIRK